MLWSVSAMAGDDWVVRHFSTADGLPVSSASAARTDRDGFLWLATHDGLARFDGRRFEIFDMASQPAMDSNRVVGLYTDDLDRLHALTSQGTLLSVRANRIERVVPNPVQPSAAIRQVLESPFCVTLADGLFCHDDGGQFRRTAEFEPEMNVHQALPGPDGSAWLVSRDRDVWWQPPGGGHQHSHTRLPTAIPSAATPVHLPDGSLLVPQIDHLLRITHDGDTVRYDWPDLERFPESELIRLHRADGMAVWVGTSRALYRLNAGTGKWSRPAMQGLPASSETSARPGPSIGWTAEDGTTWNVLAGTLYRNQQKVLTTEGLIQDVYQSDEGLVWISTLRDGVYSLSRPRVDLIDRRDGLQSENLYGVSLDSEGQLWLGSLSGGIQVISNDSVRYYGTDEGLPGENPWAVIAAPEGTVYVATFQPGLYALRPGRDRFQAVVLPADMAGMQLRALSLDADQRLWAGGETGVWRQDADGWSAFCVESLGEVTVLSILHMHDGARWYGTSEGLWYEDERSCRPFAADHLGDFEARNVFLDSAGRVWASTLGHGLIHIRAPADSTAEAPGWQRLGRQQGLPSNSLHAVAEDAEGNLWVNSNQGVFRISRADLNQYLDGESGSLSPLVLTRADGLRELEGNGGVQPAVAVDPDGRILFPSQAGLVSIEPQGLPLRAQAPTAVIDALVAGGVAQDIRQNPSLPIGQRNLQIRFAAADLRGGRDRFRYRLVPVGRNTSEETPWEQALGQNTTSLIALAPGRYRFEVLAGNNDGVWSAQPAVAEFSIPAYWHETAGFRLSLLALALLGLGLAVHWRMQSLKRQRSELNRQVNVRTRELAAEKVRAEQTLARLADAHESLAETHDKLARRNRKLAAQTDRLISLDGFRKRLLADVSHELRTPLMLIELPLAELDSAGGPDSARLNEAQRRNLAVARAQTDRLGQLVNQLVTLVQAESGQLELNIRHFGINELITDLTGAYRLIARQRGIELQADVPDTDLKVFADRDQVITALGNLIDNAIKHSPDGSRIEIVRRRGADETTVQLAVIDQGPGFDASLTDRLFDRFYRHEQSAGSGRTGLGIGLALAREISQLHGGSIGARNRARGGAEFWLELPLGSSHIALEDLALDDDTRSGAPVAEPAIGSTAEGLLLVEDHPELAAFLTERLNELLPTCTVASAEDALDVLARRKVGLVVSDVMLPGMSGLELCRRTSGEPDRPPVILISARAGSVDRQSALDAGASEFLAKPFGMNALFDAVATAWPTARKRMNPAECDHHGDSVMAPAASNLSDPDFGVDEWARAVHLSPRQLRRRVAEICGLSPLAWLREQRLLQVRSLVSSGTCKTLAEAGARSGLENPAYLYRLYRARFGD